jgi:hypothetical protein
MSLSHANRRSKNPRRSPLFRKLSPLKLSIATLLALFTTALAAAQDKDLLQGVTYICNGERMFIENCNIRDLSDNANCMVGHPDHVMPNGIMQYTNVTRGALKKLFPTCTQPSAKELAAHQAFQKKQQEIYDANVAKANPQPIPNRAQAPGADVSLQQICPPKNAEERAMRRCVSSGRLPATCTGNSLLGAFSQMIAQVAPSIAKEPPPGPDIAGVFEGGVGHWRLDFIDGGVLVNCSFLSPNQQSYTIDFKTGHAVITIDTTPRPLVLSLRSNESIVGPGPVVIDGVVAAGSSGGGSAAGHYENQQVTSHQEMTGLEAQTHAGESGLSNKGGGVYDLATNSTQSTYVPGTASAPHTTFAHKRATCPALNLSSKGAGVGVQTMQTDLLKSMFSDGDKGPPTPPGIRMHASSRPPPASASSSSPSPPSLAAAPTPPAPTPTSSRLTERRQSSESTRPITHSRSPSLQTARSILAALAPTRWHGRIVTGQNDNDDFIFAPLEQTCNLAVLSPSKTIPTVGGGAAMLAASAGIRSAGTSTVGTLSTPATPLGNATLSIISGFPAQPGVSNPLAGRPYVLLRDTYANPLAKGGVSVPPGMSPHKYVGNACGPSRTPNCQKVLDAIKADAASAVRADGNGSETFPGVAPGVYYLMISTRYDNQAFVWGQVVQLKAGPNSVALDLRNATPVN